MKKIDELKNNVKDILIETLNVDSVLEVPLFGIVNGELFFQYLGVKFKNDKVGKFKTVEEVIFLRQDMKTGEILDIVKKDTGTKVLLDEKLVKEEESLIFDYSKYVINEFLLWKKDLKEKLKIKSNEDRNDLYEEKLLKMNGSLISPKDYVLDNFEKVFNQINSILNNNYIQNLSLGSSDLLNIMVYEIRDKYLYSNVIDYALIKKYMNYIKCLWPKIIPFLRSYDNFIKLLDDSSFDDLLNDYLFKE